MALYSFIDHGNKDFLRDERGQVIRKEFTCQEAAEDWLLSNQSKTDWTNQGTTYFDWDED